MILVVRHSARCEQIDGKTATTKDTKSTKREFDELSNRVIGCAIEVHRHLGPGLLESTYEQCLAHELRRNAIAFQLQHPLPVLAGVKIGLLMNFNVIKRKDGIKRFVL